MVKTTFGWLLVAFGSTFGIATILGFVVILRSNTGVIRIGPYELLLLLVPGFAIFSLALGVSLLKKAHK